MQVTVIGVGYVGLVTGACLADIGHDVICLDNNPKKVEALAIGTIPFYEPGLQEVVQRGLDDKRLHFTTDALDAITHGGVIIIAVGTPPLDDGSADLSHVLAVVETIGRLANAPKVVVSKSTVPVGTADTVRAMLAGLAVGFEIVSNPEFLREGSAVHEFMKPDRIIVGGEDAHAVGVVCELYAPLGREVLVMDSRSAELTKYAANAMLATRISFMNEIACVAERVGADIEKIRAGIGSDSRIGGRFLHAGTGYGGSCFPKDVRALIQTGRRQSLSMRLLSAVEYTNHEQKRAVVSMAVLRFGADLTDRTFAVWGLSFKPDTDDMREAPSVVIISTLVAMGAKLRVFDPVAIPVARALLGYPESAVYYATDQNDALRGCDALIIVTEWKEFRAASLTKIASELTTPIIFDGRNIFEPVACAAAGIEYHAIGRPVYLPAHL